MRRPAGASRNIGVPVGRSVDRVQRESVATTAIFWIETVKNPDGTTFLQLQYTQRVLLVFNGLVWPHISVATLT